MFQFKSRVSSLTYSEDSRAEINEQLLELQEKNGITFSSIKHAFEFMLAKCLQDEVQSIPDGKTLISVENLENLESENSRLGEHSNHLKTITDLLDNFYENIGLNRGSRTHVYMISELISESLRQPVTKTIEVEKEISLAANQFILTISQADGIPLEKKLQLLEIIKSNRAKKFGDIDTLEQMMERMIFNDNNIFDLGGEFYTGISTRGLKKIIKG